MRAYDIITKKKRREELSDGEIRYFVNEYTAGNIPDYQAAALLMAITINGMSDGETCALTDAIMRSGDTVDLSEFGTLTADKHSTGGVGDKTTLIVAPIAAALGLKVAKMSGKGLGHTGGTVDKLDAIPGYKTALPTESFKKQVRDIGIAVIGQTGNLAPADKKLYALRDVTATVDSIPLITSSIMGKKLAAGSHSIVLDVKCGSGAFVKTPEEAEALAKSMVKIGKSCGRNTCALITDMDVPLGHAVGNILEVKEAMEVLRGEGDGDITQICLSLAAAMAHLALGISLGEAKSRAEEAVKSGKAFEKFKEWVTAQGADPTYIDSPELLPKAKHEYGVKATRDGFIAKTDTEGIGLAAMELGAGRRTKEDAIDYSAGIILHKKTGDRLRKGDIMATLYADSEEKFSEAERIFLAALTVADEMPKKKPLIYKTIT